MRRWTLLTIIALLLTFAIVAIVHFRSATAPDRAPGPELSPFVSPAGD